MANLQIKGIKDEFYAQIKALADSENRSISQQVLFLIKEYIAKEKSIKKTNTPAQVLLELTGSWGDTQKAEEIVSELKRNRKNSNKLSEGF
ncbi:MAG: hypothetical protein JRF45_09750 [Deltaproteobacteria bacterium]|nr:hypothetical protein [Deltaproteobacteria bacterium]